MMIVYLRRFAGLTSFDSKRWRSHLSARGPLGLLASRIIVPGVLVPASWFRRSLREVHPDGNDREAAADEDGQGQRQPRQSPRVARMVGAKRLERARDPMPQVQSHGQRAQHVQ